MSVTDLLLETVGRELLLTVKENLNSAIDDVWTIAATEDIGYYGSLNEEIPETPKLYPVSFYLGHHPDILEHDVADYPNVTTMCYEHNPVGEFQGIDQVEELKNRAYVEAFVADSDASTVNRLAWRYSRAIHRVLTEHKSLGQWPAIWEIVRSPTVTISSSIARKVTDWTDEWTYVQGCRLEMQYITPQTW